jgi:hypothetical protein
MFYTPVLKYLVFTILLHPQLLKKTGSFPQKKPVLNKACGKRKIPKKGCAYLLKNFVINIYVYDVAK